MQEKFFTTNTKDKTNNKDKLVYCPLNDVVPSRIKQNYNDSLKKKIIPRTSYFNAVSNILGINSWNDYLKEFDSSLEQFMINNDLKIYSRDKNISIINTYHPFNFNYRDIADRLFLSNKKLPKAIFTGYKNSFFKENISTILAHGSFLINEDYNFDITLESSVHLIGDLCVKNNGIKDDLFFQLYERGTGLYNHTKVHYKLLRIMKKILLKQSDGWLDVIPYNENLIFLKAKDGTYDFVFRGMRDTKFISPYQDFLKIEDTPSDINENYDFQFWLYHGRKHKKESTNLLWKEKDEHLAEVDFYKNRVSEDYPGLINLLKDYYKNKGLYDYKNNQSKHVHENYQVVELEDKKLCISQLVSISDFFEFYNADYKARRSEKLEEIYSINFEKPDYPVSVTWYDAIAYCKYLQTKYRKPFRLLTLDEFEYISPKIEINENTCPENELYYSYNYNDFKYPAPKVEKYENLLLKFSEPLEFLDHKGLIFPRNSRFKEWSKDFIENTVSLCSAYDDKYYSSVINRFSSSSNIKYKYLKVGFRVCYEVSKDEL